MNVTDAVFVIVLLSLLTSENTEAQHKVRITKATAKETSVTVMWHGPDRINSYVIAWSGRRQYTDEKGHLVKYSVTDFVVVGGSEYKLVIAKLLPSVQYVIVVSGITHKGPQAYQISESDPVLVRTKQGDIAQAPMPRVISYGPYGSSVTLQLEQASDKAAPISMYELMLRDVRESRDSSSVAAFAPAESMPEKYKLEAVSSEGRINLKEDHAYSVALKVVVKSRCNIFYRMGHYSNTFSTKPSIGSSSSHNDNVLDSSVNKEKDLKQISQMNSNNSYSGIGDRRSYDSTASPAVGSFISWITNTKNIAIVGGIVVCVVLVSILLAVCIRKRCKKKQKRRLRNDSLWYDPIDAKRQDLPTIPEVSPSSHSDEMSYVTASDDIEIEKEATVFKCQSRHKKSKNNRQLKKTSGKQQSASIERNSRRRKTSIDLDSNSAFSALSQNEVALADDNYSKSLLSANQLSVTLH